MSLSIIILAAGQGKRMGSSLPKVLQPLAGRPLLDHVLSRARALNPRGVCIVYGHGGDAVRQAFPDDSINWAHQAEQLGTGHAVQQAMPMLPDDDTVLVLCGDVPLVSLESMTDLVAAGDKGLAVLTVEAEQPQGYGRIIRDAAGAVIRIVEHGDATDEELRIREINTGLIACPAPLLSGWLERLRADNAQNEYYLTDIVEQAVADGAKVRAVLAADETEVMGINDRSQLASAEAEYRRRACKDLMDSGATLADPHRVDIRGNVTCGQDVFIDVNVIFEGEVTLGDNVIVGPHSVISSSRIGSDTRIHSHCVIQEASIGVECELGPYARLRPAAELAQGAKVGNFVEIKKSTVGRGSKVNHLSYIGDARIGESVNVGAGTITCNYDGANKHQTIIGNNAFIGSGVELVAPVEVGAGATIGAGSTISRNAPEGQLTLERSRQSSLPGWQRPEKK